MSALYWLVLGGLSLTAGDVVFKYWLERSLPYLNVWYIGGILLYLVGLVCLIESFRTENIAVASAIFILVNIATLALVSWIYFGEKISPLEGGGLALASIAIFILGLAK